jgi:hypothetical protein
MRARLMIVLILQAMTMMQTDGVPVLLLLLLLVMMSSQ